MAEGLYKFLHSVDLPYILRDETIRICAASYFRKEYQAMEVDLRDPTINDPHEGHVYQVQGDGTPGPGQQRLLASMGLNVGPDSPIYYGTGFFDNVIIEYVDDFHMFCLADGPLEELVPQFCKPHPDRPGAPVYNACVEILDSQALGAALAAPYPYSAIIKNIQSSGRDIPFNIVFAGVCLRPVEYAPIQVGFEVMAPAPSEFLKSEYLSWQREVRYVFRLPSAEEIKSLEDVPGFAGFKGVSPDPCMIVHVPGLRAIVREVDIAPFL